MNSPIQYSNASEFELWLKLRPNILHYSNLNEKFS